MRLFLFSHHFPPGNDAASVTMDKIVSFLEPDHELIAFLPQAKDTKNRPTVTIISAPHLPAILTYTLSHLLNIIQARRALYKFGRPNWILAEYTPHTLAASAGLLAGLLLRVPVIVKAHDIVPVHPQNPIKALSIHLTSTLNRLLVRRARWLLVVSPELKDLSKQLFGLPDDRIIVQPNGTDVPETRRMAPANANVLFVGGLYPEDGLEMIFPAWQTIEKEFPAAHLRIVGDGPLRPSFEQEVHKLGLTRVTFVGYIPHQDVAAEIGQARVCIGTLKQTFQLASAVPNKTVEYLAQGRAIISSKISRIIPEECYLRIGSQADIESALRRLLKDKQAAIILEDRAYRLAQTTFAWPVILTTMNKVLDDQ